ncbi:MAG: 6-bladed beta-propeller [Candidatus Symbiothrix sp.]|nr:6-bladed beta-propeller [Candidatus Symbiothrix sp.]
MTTKNFILYTTYCILLLSCHRDTQLTDSGYDYYIPISKEELKQASADRLSTVIKSYRFITLETSDWCLLTNIKKIVDYKDKIFILDQKNNTGVFVFDTIGKYLYTIGKKGIGPDEIINLKSFVINKENDTLILLDAEGKKMLFFSLDGAFLSCEKLKYVYSSIELVDNRHLAAVTIGTASDYALQVLDLKGNITANLIKRTVYNDVERLKPFTGFDDHLFYSPSDNDTIYSVHKENYSVRTVIDYGFTPMPS